MITLVKSMEVVISASQAIQCSARIYIGPSSWTHLQVFKNNFCESGFSDVD